MVLNTLLIVIAFWASFIAAVSEVEMDGLRIITGDNGKTFISCLSNQIGKILYLSGIQCDSLQCAKEAAGCTIEQQSNAALTTITTTRQCTHANGKLFYLNKYR